MFRERASTLQAVSLLLDIGCIFVGFGIALGLRVFHEHLPVVGNVPALPWDAELAARADYAVLLGVSIVAWFVALRSWGVYRSHRSERLTTVLSAYLRAMVLAVLATGTSTFVLDIEISRIFFGYFFVTAFVLLTIKQAAVISVIRQFRRSGYNVRHALIVGSGRTANWFASVLLDARQAGYHLVGLVVTKPDERIAADELAVPVVGTVEELPEVLANYPVDEVFLVGGAAALAEMAPTAQDLVERGRVVSLVTPLASGRHGVRGRVTEFSGIPMISFGPMPYDEVRTGAKRLTDVAAASVGLMIAAPVMLIVVAMIKLSDRGPAIFAQERLGQGGKKFKLYKFRSMRPDAVAILEADSELYSKYVANDFKLEEDEDPRVSKLGRFLRKSSLDELPQLWNVLKGDMTMVGPRPIVPAEIARYEPYENVLLSVKPGLTGHWQVSGRSDVQYPERAFMDFDYVGQHAIGSDFSILAKTVPAVMFKRGAH